MLTYFHIRFCKGTSTTKVKVFLETLVFHEALYFQEKECVGDQITDAEMLDFGYLNFSCQPFFVSPKRKRFLGKVAPKKVKEQRTCVRCSRLVPSPRYFAKTGYWLSGPRTWQPASFAGLAPVG